MLSKQYLSITLIAYLALATSFTAVAQSGATQDADLAFGAENYFTAVDLYKKAYTKESKKDEKIRIIYRIGQCYRFLEDAKQAEEWFGKAELAKYGDQDPELFYNIAEVKRVLGQFDEAAKYYKTYQSLVPTDARTNEGLRSCELARKWQEEPGPYIVENVSGLNSKQYDYSVALLDRKQNDVIIVSSRPGAMGSATDDRSGEAFMDLFMASQDRKGKWSTPTPFPAPINSEFNEGPVSTGAKEKFMFYTHCPLEKNKVLACEIWQATKVGQDWAEPLKVKLFEDSISVGHPYISPDDKLLFFTATNAPGGAGGRDIWYVEWDNKANTFGSPVNVSGVNTQYDELFPCLRDNGELYFSSNGYPGVGDWDIFKAPKTGNNQWGSPENMKPPINSPSKDFAINFMKKKEQGYFSSNRPGGKGQTDIYSFKMPPIIYTLQGTIKDVDCKKPIAGATVKLIGTDGSSVEALTDDQGFYKFDEKENGDRFLIDNTSYTIVVNKTSKAKNISTDCNSTDFTKRGYLNGKGQETTVGVERSTAFVHDFEIQCSNCGEIKFRTVLYELAKWDLMVTDQVNSKDSLNDLYQTLIDNPNIVIELAAHTDSRDSDQRNLVLSQKRAQSCVDYLVEKGIDPARLVPKGYGESNLLITDAEIAKLKSKEEKEAAHQKNRRTVFSVLRDDFVPTEAPQGDAPQGEEK